MRRTAVRSCACRACCWSLYSSHACSRAGQLLKATTADVVV